MSILSKNGKAEYDLGSSINLMSHLNLVIAYMMRGELKKSFEVANLEWLSYNKAKDINFLLQQEKIPRRPLDYKFIGLFCGVMVGANLGDIGVSLVSPLLSGIVIGLAGGVIGYITESVCVVEVAAPSFVDQLTIGFA